MSDAGLVGRATDKAPPPVESRTELGQPLGIAGSDLFADGPGLDGELIPGCLSCRRRGGRSSCTPAAKKVLAGNGYLVERALRALNSRADRREPLNGRETAGTRRRERIVESPARKDRIGARAFPGEL
jgi:hypothetical protein